MAIQGINGISPMQQLLGMGKMTGTLAIRGMNSQSTLSNTAADGTVSGNVSAFGDRVEISGTGRMASIRQMQASQRQSEQPEPDATGMSQYMMSILDANGDGSLSSEELGNLSGQFAEADTDSDGLIGQAELASAISTQMGSLSEAAAPAMQGPPPPPDASAMSAGMISDLDTNGDGNLSAEELGDLSDQLASADTDSDGLISQEELASAISDQIESLSEANASAMQGSPPPPPDAAAMSARMISDLDANGDGSLSAEELGDLSDQLASADTDSDGLISQEELASAIENLTEVSMQSTPTPPDAAAMSTQMISDLDTNGDEALSAAELGDLSASYADADKDGNGLISREELLASISSKIDEMGGLPKMGRNEPHDLNVFKQMIGKGMEQSGNTSGTESNISLITGMLGELGLSEDETQSVLSIIQNARIDISA